MMLKYQRVVVTEYIFLMRSLTVTILKLSRTRYTFFLISTQSKVRKHVRSQQLDEHAKRGNLTIQSLMDCTSLVSQYNYHAPHLDCV